MTPCDEVIKFKYRVDNGGEMPLLDCVVTDTNLSLSPEPLHIGDLNPGPGLWREIVGPMACSEGLDDAEPGTLMVVCGCVDSSGTRVEVSATDTAQFTCAGCQGGGGGEPGVMVMEICDPQVDGTNKINATVKNSGDLELENCVVTARVYEGDGDCPGAGPATEVGQENIPLLEVGTERDGDVRGRRPDRRLLQRSRGGLRLRRRRGPRRGRRPVRDAGRRLPDPDRRLLRHPPAHRRAVPAGRQLRLDGRQHDAGDGGLLDRGHLHQQPGGAQRRHLDAAAAADPCSAPWRR